MKKLILVAVTLALGSLGCESDCERLCERSKECSVDQEGAGFLSQASCGDVCDLSEEFAELVDCDGAWSDWIACTADNLPPEGCGFTTANTCTAEQEAYSRCFGFDDDDESGI